MYDAEAQFQDQLLEKQKQVAQTAAGLYHTLFTQPDKFAKQLQSTIKEAALKPVTEGLGNLTAKAVTPLIYGSDGQGGIGGAFFGDVRSEVWTLERCGAHQWRDARARD